MGQGVHRILIKKAEWKRSLGITRKEERIILKWIFSKQ
jgi:hypothetical protein